MTLLGVFGTAMGAAIFAASPLLANENPLAPLPPAFQEALFIAAGIFAMALGAFEALVMSRYRALAILSPQGVGAHYPIRWREFPWSAFTKLEVVKPQGRVIGFWLKVGKRYLPVTVVIDSSDTSESEVRDYIRKYRPDLFERQAPSASITSV